MDPFAQVKFLLHCDRLDNAAAFLSTHSTSSTSSSNQEASLLQAQLAFKQGNLNATERHLKSIEKCCTDHMHRQQQLLQQQLTSTRPLLHAAEAALTAGAWQTAREQAAACLAAIKPATSCAPGFAVRLLLLQATASSQLQDHEDSVQVGTHVLGLLCRTYT
jgi:hypothetical protein